MRTHIALTTVGVSLVLAGPAIAGSHLWDLVEIYSNSDGTIQYIELQEMEGAGTEWHLNGKTVTSDQTGSLFTFPEDLPPGSTANKHLLLGTAAYAAIPGAVQPDYLINENFIALDDDAIVWWTYDVFNFPLGALPLDGKNALHRAAPGPSGPFVPGPNTPENFNDEKGSIDACPTDLDGDGEVGIEEFLAVLGGWGTPDGDVTGDGDTDIDDFLAVLGNWGPC